MNQLFYKIFLNNELIAIIPETQMYIEVIKSITDKVLFGCASDITVNELAISVGFYDDKGTWHAYGE